MGRGAERKRPGVGPGVAALSFAAMAGYLLWSRSGRCVPSRRTGILTHAEETGCPSDRGNLLAVQPWLDASDYCSPETLRAVLETYLHDAARRGWTGPKTIAVFPEYIGTWLVAAGEKRGVFSAARLTSGMALLAAGNLFSLIPRLLASPESDRIAAALFRMKARQMAAGYTRLFGSLAREYGITIAAGSTVLPEPSVRRGCVHAGRGPLRNVAAVFHPDGRADAHLTIKAFPTSDEAAFTSAGMASDLPVYQTPAGRLGVLICADAWYPEPYAALRENGADLLAVAAYVVGDGALDGIWRGYSGADAPRDIDPADVGRITLREAWRKYATLSRATRAGFTAAVTAHLRGRFWDLGSDGSANAVLNGQMLEDSSDGRGTLLNVWL